MKLTIGNPVKGGDFFDREVEQKRLWRQLESDNVLMLAPRRMKANIKRPAFDTQLKRPALYNPGLWSAAEARAYYIARTSLLERLLGDLRREVPGSQPQHRLIVGQRDMGKSTLLRRLAIGVEDDAQLEKQWLPLIFPEEQYNVGSLADFWLNCLDALGDLQEARGDHALASAIDAEVERIDRGDSDGALRALLRIAGKLQRRVLLLVDNIDLILERIKTQDWALREVLQGHSELLLVGASGSALKAAYDYGAAFYDFFKIDELRGLSEDEMRETILTLARLRGADDVVRRIESDPGRLPVLHTLTGGNPRTAVLLYGALLKGVDGDVRSDLEALLDEVTPLYKARFDELPTQAQQLLDKLALNWDPITARGLADLLGWPVNLVSAQLDRLAGSGVVEKVKFGSGKRLAFQVGERFFNIWYLMRASRRVRRKLMWLVEFLRAFFSADELHKLARQRLSACVTDAQDVEYTRAPSRKLPESAANEARGVELEPENGTDIFLFACRLFAHGNPDEALLVSCRWLTWLGAQESADTETLEAVVALVQRACASKRAAEILAALDASEVGQRYRPVREALAAVVAGNADFLNGVAPEVRKPALEVLALIAPQLLKDSL